jgi:hypothetical protein
MYKRMNDDKREELFKVNTRIGNISKKIKILQERRKELSRKNFDYNKQWNKNNVNGPKKKRRRVQNTQKSIQGWTYNQEKAFQNYDAHLAENNNMLQIKEIEVELQRLNNKMNELKKKSWELVETISPLLGRNINPHKGGKSKSKSKRKSKRKRRTLKKTNHNSI